MSNELIRDALHPYPEDLATVSKVGARRDAEGAFVSAQTPDDLRADVEENLLTMRTDQLTAVNLRRMDEHDAGPRVPLEDQLAEMVALRDEGKIAGIGVSTVSAEQVTTAIALATSCASRTHSASSTSTTATSSSRSGNARRSTDCW